MPGVESSGTCFEFEQLFDLLYGLDGLLAIVIVDVGFDVNVVSVDVECIDLATVGVRADKPLILRRSLLDCRLSIHYNLINPYIQGWRPLRLSSGEARRGNDETFVLIRMKYKQTSYSF